MISVGFWRRFMTPRRAVIPGDVAPTAGRVDSASVNGQPVMISPPIAVQRGDMIVPLVGKRRPWSAHELIAVGVYRAEPDGGMRLIERRELGKAAKR